LVVVVVVEELEGEMDVDVDMGFLGEERESEAEPEGERYPILEPTGEQSEGEQVVRVAAPDAVNAVLG
jgi:hypothetical protein